MTTVDVVMVAYGDGPWLEAAVDAVLASTGVDVQVFLVDNGDTTGAVDRLSARGAVTVLRPGANTGFAGGCNIGADAGHGDVLALVNPDVIVEPPALGCLADAVSDPGTGIATASLRLADTPDLLNSAGNPVSFLGVAWAGAFGEPAAAHDSSVCVASASGACCAVLREIWVELGGFETNYFAYHEDVELSLRCWQRGLEVRYVPDAVARHHYEFRRNSGKNYLLERNRWLTILTVFSGRLLVLLTPALIAFEVLVVGAAAAQGWLPAKLSGYRWLWCHVSLIRTRRSLIQSQRRCSDKQLAALFAPRIEPANLPAMPGMRVANAILAGYWNLVRRLL